MDLNKYRNKAETKHKKTTLLEVNGKIKAKNTTLHLKKT